MTFDMKKWKENNKEHVSQYRKIYREKNLEKEKLNDKNWYKKNKEYKLLYCKKRNLIIMKQLKNRYHTDISYKIKKLVRKRIWQAMKNNSRDNTIKYLLGCSYSQLKQHLENQFKDGMDWDNHGRTGWHIDHIKPCCSFDLSDPEEQKKCFNYTNLQPLWAEDNYKKGRKIC